MKAKLFIIVTAILLITSCDTSYRDRPYKIEIDVDHSQTWFFVWYRQDIIGTAMMSNYTYETTWGDSTRYYYHVKKVLADSTDFCFNFGRAKDMIETHKAISQYKNNIKEICPPR